MNIYEAVMKAADQIEREPHSFDYTNPMTFSEVPARGGCWIGWTAFFMGEPAGVSCGSLHGDAPLCRKLLGVSFNEFNARMRALTGANDDGWDAVTRNKAKAAAALRAYAQKYLAPAKPGPRYDFNGLADRLAAELRIVSPSAPPERSLSAPSVRALGRVA